MSGSVDTSGTTGGNVLYTYTASNGVCPDESTTVTVVVNSGCDFTAGVEEFATSFEMVPNPTNGQVNITWSANATGAISITDLNGKVLQSVQVVGQQTTIDLSNYTPGVYLITLQVGEQVNTQRIIKQ